VRSTGFICAILLLAALRLEGSNQPGFAGTWEGTMGDQPAIDLVIHDDSGKISGDIAFYTLVSDSDAQWHVADKLTVPLLSPKVNGETLTFHARYYKSRHNSQLGVFKCRVVLGGPDSATFRRIGASPNAPPLQLAHQK